MILPGHLAAGYITTYSLLALVHPDLTLVQKDILLVWGTLCGDLPDIDIFYSMVRKFSTKPMVLDGHRKYITHAPIVWLILGLALYFVFTNPLYKYMGLLVWLGAWTHLLCDSVDHGVRWLWPFSEKRFSLIPPPEHEEPRSSSYRWADLFRGYFTIATFYLEIFMVVLAVALFVLS